RDRGGHPRSPRGAPARSRLRGRIRGAPRGLRRPRRAAAPRRNGEPEKRGRGAPGRDPVPLLERTPGRPVARGPRLLTTLTDPYVHRWTTLLAASGGPSDRRGGEAVADRRGSAGGAGRWARPRARRAPGQRALGPRGPPLLAGGRVRDLPLHGASELPAAPG